MGRTITTPPHESASPDGIKPGGWWHDSADGAKVICDLCPRACAVSPGQRGFCFVRQNLDGRMVLTTYGRSTGFCIDPIEKKPAKITKSFFRARPSCPLGRRAAIWAASSARTGRSPNPARWNRSARQPLPEAIALAAQEHDCKSVAFTYNDPIIWAEYAIDTARACHELGVQTVAVTSGYITPEARTSFYQEIDAANVDLKAFTEEFYQKLTAGHLEPVRDTLRWLVHETDVWVEITNLVIPQANDSDDELKELCSWIVEELRPDVPVHFSAFHPDFRMTDPPSHLPRNASSSSPPGTRGWNRVCVHRESPGPGQSEHVLPRLPQPTDRASRVPNRSLHIAGQSVRPLQRGNCRKIRLRARNVGIETSTGTNRIIRRSPDRREVEREPCKLRPSGERG